MAWGRQGRIAASITDEIIVELHKIVSSIFLAVSASWLLFLAASPFLIEENSKLYNYSKDFSLEIAFPATLILIGPVIFLLGAVRSAYRRRRQAGSDLAPAPPRRLTLRLNCLSVLARQFGDVLARRPPKPKLYVATMQSLHERYGINDNIVIFYTPMDKRAKKFALALARAMIRARGFMKERIDVSALEDDSTVKGFRLKVGSPNLLIVGTMDYFADRYGEDVF